MAIRTGSATDVLSHIAIRARAQGVLLATCFDAAGALGRRAPPCFLPSSLRACSPPAQCAPRPPLLLNSLTNPPLPLPCYLSRFPSSAELEGIQAKAGGHVLASVGPTGDVTVTAAEAGAGGGAGASNGGGAPRTAHR